MSILSDDSTGLSEGDAEAALMERLGGDPEDTNTSDDDQDQDADEGDEADQDDDDDEQPEDADDGDEGEGGDESPDDDDDAGEDEGDKAPPAAAVADDTVVQVTVNGETKDFTVGSLKRLAGQEAALTQKSQEAELVGGRAAAALQAALEVIQEDLAPYQDVDWMVLQQELEPSEFAWHRENARKLSGRFDKLVQAAQTFEKTVADRQTNETRRAAQACVAELKQDIPGWDDKLYSDILSFGVDQGLPEAEVASITNPTVIKLLRKAMLYDRGQAVATKKVKDIPTKVLRGGARQDTAARAVNVRRAEKRLETTGSDKDAMAVLLGRWGGE